MKLDKLLNELGRLGRIVTASELDKPAPKKSPRRAPSPRRKAAPKAPAEPPAPPPPAPQRRQSSAEDEWDRMFEQFLDKKEKQEGRRIINPLKEDQTSLTQERPAAPAPQPAASKPADEWDRQFEQFMREKTASEEQARIGRMTELAVPEGYINPYKGDKRAEGVYCAEIPDALSVCLDRLGFVDVEYISEITGKDICETVGALRGLCYCDPEKWGECFYKGWVTASEYLSGNMIKRYNAAKAAEKKYGSFFTVNVKDVEKALPPPLDAKDIYATLGSPWIPADVIDDFIAYILGPANPRRDTSEKNKTIHDSVTGVWEIPSKSRFGHSSRSLYYGTNRIGALQLMEKLLNCRQVQIFDTETNSQGKAVRVLNEQETVAALECERRQREDFSEWLWKDPRRGERLEMIFENNFSSRRSRVFDGSFLTFPEMAEDISLYDFQKEAVAKILFTPSTLLAHEVGSGKTFIMAAAGMKLRQLGLSKRNMFIVPNSLVGQWEGTFRRIYPRARIIVIDPPSFTKEKKQQTLRAVRDTDFDAVIIAFSCFDRIPLSDTALRRLLTFDYEEIARCIAQHGSEPKALHQKRISLLSRIKALEVSEKSADPEEMTFDALGITALFLDEAHNYKNIPIDSSAQLIGVNVRGSDKCARMLEKVRHTLRTGRCAVFATGTPITNSISDAYTVQRYLQFGDLKELGLRSFDSWVGMFAEAKTDFEIDVDTSGYRMCRRLRTFHNLPELTALFSDAAHFHKTDGNREIPDFAGHDDCTVPKCEALAQYLREISERAETVRRGEIDGAVDNMLKITTDGRKAALDIRLVVPEAGEQEKSKVRFCAQNVYEIWSSDEKRENTQLVFCDISTPKAEFNIYDELKRLLTEKGIPEKEIEFIHSFDTDEERVELFERVNEGKVRVLMGSTFKLGTGVNVQKRLKAVHHLDVPWRPSDMIQREGRILRPGNMNKSVRIFRYITEGSFDAYSWQLLETKQSFITQLLANELVDRSGTEVDNAVLSYAEVKALAVGNPLIKQRIETANQLSRFKILQRQQWQRRAYLHERLEAIPGEREKLLELLAAARDDLEELRKPENAVTADNRTALREALEAAVSSGTFSTDTICEHRGFKVSLQPNMLKTRPAVRLERRGCYFTELGESPLGYPVRVDNALDRIPDFIEEQEERISELERENVDAQTELDINKNYLADIERCEKELARIDTQLST
ncbi:MAG: DEAD/DEAH box helicase family protein [Ruminococcus sp.]|nr:DEAD/DEAH box helicase family protein [Ruminococcus sp.]